MPLHNVTYDTPNKAKMSLVSLEESFPLESCMTRTSAPKIKVCSVQLFMVSAVTAALR